MFWACRDPHTNDNNYSRLPRKRPYRDVNCSRLTRKQPYRDVNYSKLPRKQPYLNVNYSKLPRKQPYSDVNYSKLDLLFYLFDATLIGTRISLFVFKITRPSRWPIRSCCVSKLRATGFKSWSGRMLVIEVVPIQCSKLFKGMESAVMSMELCTIKSPWSYSIRLGHSPFLLSRYCHDCAESNVKQYSLEITTRV